MFAVLDGKVFKLDEVENFWGNLDTEEVWNGIQHTLQHRLFGSSYFVSPAIKFEQSFGFFIIFSDYIAFCHVIDENTFDYYFALTPHHQLCTSGSHIAFVYKKEQDFCISIKSSSILPCLVELNPERAKFLWAHHKLALEEMFIPWISNDSIKGLFFFSRQRKNYTYSWIRVSKFIKTEEGYKYETTYSGSVACSDHIYATPKGNIVIKDKTMTMVGTSEKYGFSIPYKPGEYVYSNYQIFDVILMGDDASSVYIVQESPLRFQRSRLSPYIDPEELIRYYKGASVVLSADRMRARRHEMWYETGSVKFEKYARIKLMTSTLHECKTDYESIPPIKIRKKDSAF